MADPLSIAASIIAVASAAEGMSKALMKINSLRNAPNEVLALVNEVSDLRIVLSDAKSLLIETPHISPPLQAVQHLETLLQRAKSTLLELDRIIENQLIKPNSTSESLKVSRYEWMKAKHRIKHHRQHLRDIRLNIVAQINLVNVSYQSSIFLLLNEIQVITRRLQAQNQFIQQPEDQPCQLANLASRDTMIHNAICKRPPTTAQSQRGPHPVDDTFNALVVVKASVSTRRRSHCSYSCTCVCHTFQQAKSSQFLHRAVGVLFIAYSGYPSKSLKQCNIQSCQGQRGLRLNVSYIFPLWFLYGIAHLSLIAESMREIDVSLKITRYVPANSEVLSLAFLNDIKGLQRLFNDGMASPNDMEPKTGTTALIIAVNRGHLGLCEFLLNAGADAKLDAGRTSPHIRAWNQIFESSKDQNTLTTLRHLFPADDNDLEEWEFSRLHKTVLGIAPYNVARLRIQDNLYVEVNARDSMGMTPLMWAARRGDCFAVNSLLKNGADPNICNRYSQSALLNAVRSSCPTCTTALLKARADPLQKDCQRFNALHYAALYSKDDKLARCLIDAGAELNGLDIEDATPIFCTPRQDNAATARTLLNYGADINTADGNGDSLLCCAINQSAHNTVRLLLERGASYQSTNGTGGSALHAAAQYGSLKILSVLRAATLKDIDPDALDRNGKSPLQLAQGRETAPERFVETMQALLAEIRVRNASRRESSPSSDAKVIPDGYLLTNILVTHLVVAYHQPSHIYTWVRSIAWHTWKSVLLYLLLGFGWAGFLYKLLAPG